MVAIKSTFSGFSIKDQAASKEFYTKLGAKVSDDFMGLELEMPGGQKVFVYPKENHEPATFTVLNFVVDDIDKAIDDLKELGIEMLIYEDLGLPAEQDEKGVLRGRAAKQGPDIAWFKDPSDNVLSVIQN